MREKTHGHRQQYGDCQRKRGVGEVEEGVGWINGDVHCRTI